jgi:hypothetical protein
MLLVVSEGLHQIVFVLQTLVSVRRIDDFLQEDEGERSHLR